MAQLIRDRDGEGFSGARVDVISPDESIPDEDRITAFNGDADTLVGNMLLVGSVTAGTYSARDWWRTNVIDEILSASEDEIRFSTASGSNYTLKR